MCKTKRNKDTSDSEETSRPLPREKDLFSKYKNRIYDYTPEEDDDIDDPRLSAD